MRHHASARFWDAYERLPDSVRRQADRAFALLKSDPTHRGLHFKPVGAEWSVRIGLRDRDLARKVGDDKIRFCIGTHAEYDRLVRDG